VAVNSNYIFLDVKMDKLPELYVGEFTIPIGIASVALKQKADAPVRIIMGDSPFSFQYMKSGKR
jgi:hypothetical protein